MEGFTPISTITANNDVSLVSSAERKFTTRGRGSQRLTHSKQRVRILFMSHVHMSHGISLHYFFHSLPTGWFLHCIFSYLLGHSCIYACHLLHLYYTNHREEEEALGR